MNKALESAAEDGVIRKYSGWRQSLKGKRFQIKDCILFNLETPTGKKVRRPDDRRLLAVSVGACMKFVV